jgi:SNF2 family DNA or RNA helicase
VGYTLKQFFEEAQVPNIPEWFGEVVLRHRKIKDFKPRWEQILDLNMMFAYPNLRSALFSEQATGKTLPAQAFAIYQAAIGNKAVCLMPRTLLIQFETNLFFTFEGVHKHLRCETYYGLKKQRDAICARWSQYGAPQIALTTYGMFMREFMLFRHFEYNCLIADEAKYLANEDSQTYQAMKEFVGLEGERYFLAMNGTPAGNTLVDLYGNIKFLTPKVYKSRQEFDNLHVIYKKILVRTKNKGEKTKLRKREVQIVEDYDNLDSLQENLYLQARRTEKSSLNLPPLEEIPVPFNLSQTHMEAYDQFVAERLMEFDDGSILDGTSSSALRVLAFQSIIRPELLGLSEESVLMELIDDLIEGAGGKVFLMAHFQKSVEAFRDRFAKYQPAVIYGKTRNPEKEKQRFLQMDSCKLLIVNYEAGGVGIDGLQDVCCTGICGEPTTVPKAYDQARDRIHRSGQVNPVHMYFPKARGTVFVKAMNALRKKKGWIDRVVTVGEMRNELKGFDPEDEDENVSDEMLDSVVF